MALDVGAALRDGLDRTAERNALVLTGAFLLAGLVSEALSQTVAASVAEAAARFAESEGLVRGAGPADLVGPTPLALPLGPWAAAGLALATALAVEALHVVAIRTLVSDATETVPGEFVRRNIVSATLNGFVGGIAVGLAVVVGTVLLVVPGVFLAVSFFFVHQEIAVEDENFVYAMAGSWRLSRGNRVELFGLGVVLVAVALVASAVALALGGPSLTTSLVGVVAAAPLQVFSIAVVARAYDQARTERERRIGALGPDDLDALG